MIHVCHLNSTTFHTLAGIRLAAALSISHA